MPKISHEKLALDFGRMIATIASPSNANRDEPTDAEKQRAGGEAHRKN